MVSNPVENLFQIMKFRGSRLIGWHIIASCEPYGCPKNLVSVFNVEKYRFQLVLNDQTSVYFLILR